MNERRVSYWLYGLSFLLVVFSIVLPLYSVNFTSLSQEKATVDYISFGSITNGDEDVLGYTGFQSIFNVAAELRSSLVIFIIMTIFTLALLFYRLGVIEKKEPSDKIDSSGIFAFILAIATPVVFIITWEATIKDVIGTSNLSNLLALIGGDLSSMDSVIIDASAGPGIAWYLQLIAAGFIFLAILASWNSSPASKARSSETLIVSSSGIMIKEQKEVEPNTDQMAPKLHCGNCDRIIPLDAKLCPYCGTEVKR